MQQWFPKLRFVSYFHAQYLIFGLSLLRSNKVEEQRRNFAFQMGHTIQQKGLRSIELLWNFGERFELKVWIFFMHHCRSQITTMRGLARCFHTRLMRITMPTIYIRLEIHWAHHRGTCRDKNCEELLWKEWQWPSGKNSMDKKTHEDLPWLVAYTTHCTINVHIVRGLTHNTSLHKLSHCESLTHKSQHKLTHTTIVSNIFTLCEFHGAPAEETRIRGRLSACGSARVRRARISRPTE